MKKLLIALGLAVLLSAALWLPSLAQSEGTVTATVTVQNVSVSVTPASVNYGTLAFETTKRSNLSTPAVTFTATNNGNVSENFKVRGANATVAGGPWTIQAAALTCPTINQYRHSAIGKTGVTDDAPIFMTTANSATNLVTALAANGAKDFNSEIFMPCTGSAGLGATATTSVTVVALAN